MSPKSESDPPDAVGSPLWRRIIQRIRHVHEDALPREAPEPPAGFDWRWYVTSYKDLTAAGIADEKGGALAHRNRTPRFLRRKKRRYLPASTGAGTSPPTPISPPPESRTRCRHSGTGASMAAALGDASPRGDRTASTGRLMSIIFRKRLRSCSPPARR